MNADFAAGYQVGADDRPCDNAAPTEWRAGWHAGQDAIQKGNAGIDPGTWTGPPESVDGSRAPLPTYPPETWPTCQPVGVDSLGHGFDRREPA